MSKLIASFLLTWNKSKLFILVCKVRLLDRPLTYPPSHRHSILDGVGSSSTKVEKEFLGCCMVQLSKFI